MERDPRAWLRDVRQAADRVAEFVRGQDFADYLADVKLRSAIERQLEIVDEALNNLSREAPELASRIPDAIRAIAMRNVLIHAYRNIDNDAVWQTIQVDLPAPVGSGCAADRIGRNSVGDYRVVLTCAQADTIVSAIR